MLQSESMEHLHGIVRPVPSPAMPAGHRRDHEAQFMSQKGNGARRMVPDEMHRGDGSNVGDQRWPKCPSTVAKGAGMVAWLKDGGWGSKPTREAQAGSWRKLQ